MAAHTQVSTGASAYVQYGWETPYGTPPSQASIDKPFGYDTRITKTSRNNFEPIYGLGSRDVQKLAAKKYEGTWSADFTLASAYFLRAVLGEVPVDAGATPYTHTWNATTGIVPSTTQAGMDSIAIEIGNDIDTDSVITLKGCKVNSCTLSARQGDIVRVKLDGMYNNETEGTSLDATFATETEEPMTFAQGSLVVGGTTIYDVQSCDWTIDNNIEMLWGLGSRFATKAVEKSRRYTLKLTAPYELSSDLLEKFYGGGTGPVAAPALQSTAILTFTNGLATSSERSLTVTLANLQLDEDSHTYSPGEIVNEDVSLIATSLTTAAYNDNTAAAP